MTPKTNMTIDAYLRNAGIKPAGTTDRKNFISSKTSLNSSFSENLTSALSSDRSGYTGKKTGLTVSDYLTRATTGASNDFFRNSTFRKGILRTGIRNSFGNAIVSSGKDRTTAASEPRGSEIGTVAGDATHADNDTLIADSIKNAARKYNLSEKLIERVIQAESNFQVDAVSPAGARGLMQLMPATAKELGVDDPFDVRQNIDGGAGYLRRMLDRFGGDVRLALAAYNAGPGNVEKYNGDVPFRETQDYIERVLTGWEA